MIDKSNSKYKIVRFHVDCGRPKGNPWRCVICLKPLYKGNKYYDVKFTETDAYICAESYTCSRKCMDFYILRII